jgi:hypothetical protein
MQRNEALLWQAEGAGVLKAGAGAAKLQVFRF